MFLGNCHITLQDTHTQPFYGSLIFVRDNPGELVPEETFTHSQLLWSSIISITSPYICMIFTGSRYWFACSAEL